jgi:hypothetical protein
VFAANAPFAGVTEIEELGLGGIGSSKKQPANAREIVVTDAIVMTRRNGFRTTERIRQPLEDEIERVREL